LIKLLDDSKGGMEISVFVILPALNEEASILETIDMIKHVISNARILVIDNGSTDRTFEIVKSHGVDICREPNKGKGFAVRRAFSLMPADSGCVFMLDADSTYSVEEFSHARDLVIHEGYDMVVGNRRVNRSEDQSRNIEFRRGHVVGNWDITKLSSILHPVGILDSLSGWRVMSPKFVRSFTGGASGFEIEAELNAHAYLLKCGVTNVDVMYRGRKSDSHSKLKTYKDGLKIVKMNFKIFRSNRPLLAFALLAAPWLLTSFISTGRAIQGYIRTGLVLQFPSLIAGVGTFVVGVLLVISGITLERIKEIRTTLARHAYMSTCE
jgi:glycosyltransferase involved in cell wall biosynthesis